MTNETSSSSTLGIVLIFVGVIAGIAMWEQCDPDFGRKALSDECYDAYYKNSEGECCKVYPVGATVAFAFFAIPGLYVMSFANTKEKAKKHEKLLEFDEAAEIYKELGMDEEVIRVRKLKNEQGAVKVSKKVVHGDVVTKTNIKDSVINRSNVGSSGDDKFTKLKELKEMLGEGLISVEEFEKMKKEILGK